MRFQTRLQRSQNIFVCFFVCLFPLKSVYRGDEFAKKYSLHCLRIFSGMFNTFLGMFGDISWNAWRHLPNCWRTFPGLFDDNPSNVWRHSQECSISLIQHVPRIPFSAPVLSVLGRCQLNKGLMENVCIVAFKLKLLNILVYKKQQVRFSNQCKNSLLKNIVPQ